MRSNSCGKGAAMVLLVTAAAHAMALGDPARAQPPATVAPEQTTPAIVRRFLERTGPNPTGESFKREVKEALWEIYSAGSGEKEALVGYLESAPDGPGLAFAAVALVPFRDPATVSSILGRALEAGISPTTRWWLLSAAPYVLSMGDVMVLGDGSLDSDARELAAGVERIAKRAAQTSLGQTHAQDLSALQSIPQRERGPDFGTALWHQSAYLLGTLDLRNEPLLQQFLDPDHGPVFVNVMDSLSFATARDHLAPLRDLAAESVPPALEKQVGQDAARWWRQHLSAHPDGEWVPAVIAGLAAAGYSLNEPPSPDAIPEVLVSALESEDVFAGYGAARLLNHVCGTHFDIERIFVGAKYALSFLDPVGEEEQGQKRLAAWWKGRTMCPSKR